MIKALAITGPTASGKTALSLFIAKQLCGEIISCDSMQIYRGMDIGTAKATSSERAEVPHHMIDFLDPRSSYSVADYREAAVISAKEISERGRLPIFVGGTGLYVDALMRAEMNNTPPCDPEYREALKKIAEGEGGADILWERLRALDSESAEAIHKNNIKRVIRALEICESTGRKKSELDMENRAAPADISVAMMTLDFHDRENLYSRVDKRVDQMMAEGLYSEVLSLYEAGMLNDDTTAAQAIGYKEMISHIRGEMTLASAIERIKLSSRRYAKRQLTWFRHEEDAERLFVDSECGVMKEREALFCEALELANKILRKVSI